MYVVYKHFFINILNNIRQPMSYVNGLPFVTKSIDKGIETLNNDMYAILQHDEQEHNDKITTK
jgi:hypothetical protein